MRAASFFLTMKFRERFCLTGLELSIMVLELMFDCRSDWFDKMSLMFIVWRKWLFARCFGKNAPPGALPLLVFPYIDRSMASWVKLLVYIGVEPIPLRETSPEWIVSMLISVLGFLRVVNIFKLLRLSSADSIGLSEDGRFISCL